MTYKTIILAAAVAITSPAIAADTTVQANSDTQEVVTFSDLDLTQRSGQRALKIRVKHASERLCIRVYGTFIVDWHLGGRENSCAVRTYRQARPQISTAIARAERGERLPSMALTISGLPERK